MATYDAIAASFALMKADRPKWSFSHKTIELWAEELRSVGNEALKEATRHFLRSSTKNPTLAGVLASLDAVHVEQVHDDSFVSARREDDLRAQRWMKKQTKVLVNGVEYDAPYSEGMRARALAEPEHRTLPPWYDTGATMNENLEKKRAHDRGHAPDSVKAPALYGRTTAAGVIGDVLDKMDEEAPF